MRGGDQQKTRRSAALAYVFWGAVALVVGLGGALLILSLAGITFLRPWWIFSLTVPVLDRAAHGNVVNAAVSWFAGTVALYSFHVNVSQKERHNTGLETRERDLAELQRIEAEFAALADDFAQEALLARINAAIGLGELARRPDPRREQDGAVMFDPRTDAETWVGDDGKLLPQARPWPDHWRSRKTDLNYPYFLRAAHRLAAALYLWEDAPARAQALRVLREMGDWAKDEGTDEPLLHGLVNALAEANRTAWAELRERAGMCLAMDRGVDLVRLLGLQTPEQDAPDAQVARRRKAAQEAFLADLEAGLDENPAVVAFAAQPESQRTGPAELVMQFQRAGQGFWATRDILATALQQLSLPPDRLVSQTFWGWYSDPHKSFRSRRSLDLAGVRMLSAKLRGVHSEGADCGRAHFEGADCGTAHFEGADCKSAHFEGANWFEAHIEGANCSWAHFEGANCIRAHFEGANCTGARFEWADCQGTHFEWANCRSAQYVGVDCNETHFEGADCSQANFRGAICQEAYFEGADCSKAIFEGADLKEARFSIFTKLERAQMGQSKESEPVDLSGVDWSVANFRLYSSGLSLGPRVRTRQYDRELWNFLNERYPVEEGQPPRIPPWEQAAKTQDKDAPGESLPPPGPGTKPNPPSGTHAQPEPSEPPADPNPGGPPLT